MKKVEKLKSDRSLRAKLRSPGRPPVLHRAEQVPNWPIEDALGTLSTIDALFESARSGGWIALAPGTA